MKIFFLLAAGLVISLSALSARELQTTPLTSEQDIQQSLEHKLEVMSEIMNRKNEAKAIRTYR